MKRKLLMPLSLAVILGLAAAACGPAGATPDPQSGEITIIQEDSDEGMNFDPEAVVVTAGQTVRIILENHGSKDHEFMIGQEVVYDDNGAPNGFQIDFFEGIEDQVSVELGDGAMLMIDGETIAMGGMGMDMDEEGDMDMGDGEDMDMGDGEDMDMGDGEDMDMGDGDDMEMEEEQDEDEEGLAMHMEDHSGWMVMDVAGSGTTVIEFTVPEDRVGEWEMACFEDDGTHYEDGMRGTFIVRAP